MLTHPGYIYMHAHQGCICIHTAIIAACRWMTNTLAQVSSTGSLSNVDVATSTVVTRAQYVGPCSRFTTTCPYDNHASSDVQLGMIRSRSMLRFTAFYIFALFQQRVGILTARTARDMERARHLGVTIISMDRSQDSSHFRTAVKNLLQDRRR